jgi:protein ImuB
VVPLACINVPDLPLQLLQRRHPEWRRRPVAVAADGGPQARLTSVNRDAHALGVVVGMRYAEALSIAPHLRAGVVSAAEQARLVAALARLLQRYSPGVEPSSDEPGVFWADAAGLDGLYESAASWAGAVVAALEKVGLRAAVAAGFSRFGTYAAARTLEGGIRVFASAEAERACALEAPLGSLGVPDEPSALLERLGVRTVAGLLRLPREGVRRRCGERLARLHALAAGDLWQPLQPRLPRIDPRDRVVLDAPEGSAERLLFLIKSRLPALLAALAGRGQALRRLDVRLKPAGRGGWCEAGVRPAAPTMDELVILDLVRLRLERLPLAAGIVEIALCARGGDETPAPARLLPEHPRRDLAAGRRALARVKASLGDGAVVRARVREGHLPEARFAWEPAGDVPLPRVPRPASASLRRVRRLWKPPLPLSSGLSGRRRGGPYTISGGWWVREVHRDYYFIETRRGEVLWAYHDRVRGRWRLHGRVE